MSKIIEAKAVISAEDRVGAVLDRIGKKFKDLGKGAKVSAETDRLNRSLANTRAQLEALGRVQAAQGKLVGSKLGLAGARTRADEIARQLDVVKKAGDASRTAELVAQQKAAERAVTQATGAVGRQAAAVRDARHALNEFGVPVASLTAHEQALRERVEKTTAALQKSTAADRERYRVAEAKALRRQRLREAAEAAAASPAVPAGGRRPAPPGARRQAPERAARDLGPLAGMIGAAEAVSSYRQAAAFDRRITMIGQTADAGRPEIDALAASVHNLAQETATPVDKLTGGLESLVAQGRNLREAMDFLPSVARTAAASGSEVEDIAKTADSVGTNFKIAGQQMQKAGALREDSLSQRIDLS